MIANSPGTGEVEVKKAKGKAGLVSVTVTEPAAAPAVEDSVFKAPENPRQQPGNHTHQELHFEVLSKNSDGKVTELKIENI